MVRTDQRSITGRDIAIISRANGVPVPSNEATNFFQRDWVSRWARSIRCFGWFAAGVALARLVLASQYTFSRAEIMLAIDGTIILAIASQIAVLVIIVIRSWLRFRDEKTV